LGDQPDRRRWLQADRASHQVDLTDEGSANLVHGTTPPPSVLEIATSGIALRVAGAAARRMMIALTAVNRAPIPPPGRSCA